MPLKRRFIEVGISILFLGVALLIGKSSFVIGAILFVVGLILLWRQLELSRKTTAPRQQQGGPRQSIGGFISEHQIRQREAQWRAEIERRRQPTPWNDPLGWAARQVFNNITRSLQNSQRDNPLFQPWLRSQQQKTHPQPPRRADAPPKPQAFEKQEANAVPQNGKKTAPPDPETQLPDGEVAYTHALAAARAANLDVYASVLPVDLGIMVYKGDERFIYRAQPAEDDAEYIQPFIVLKMRTRAVGRIRFEIIDHDGQRLFVYEDNQDLEAGRNLISPAARLRMLDSFNYQGQWALDVSADNVPLASHRFSWEESRTTILRRQLREDGELHQAARVRLMDDDPFNRLTLDDLLADQTEEEVQHEAAQKSRR